VVATAWRCMNVSTAPQASASRVRLLPSASPAGRQVRTLRDHASGLGSRERRAVGQDPGVDHEQLMGDRGSRPSMIQLNRHVGIDGENQLGQLRSPIRRSRAVRSFATSGSSSSAASGVRCNSSSTRSVPAFAARLQPSSRSRHAPRGVQETQQDQWGGPSGGNRGGAAQPSGGPDEQPLPAANASCGRSRRSIAKGASQASKVATSKAQNARSRSAREGLLPDAAEEDLRANG